MTLSEATKSSTAIRLGIDNTPPPDVIENMKHVATHVFDEIREHIGGPLGITSFYRCEELNTAIGGSTTSQHRFGQAIDLDADKYGVSDNIEIFNFVKDSLPFDQLIAEFEQNNKPAWIHVSLKRAGEQRKQILIARKVVGKTVYSPYTKQLFDSLYSK